MMKNGAHMEQEWLTLEQASKLTGKSTGALRLAIQRKKFMRTKKMRENGREFWVLHKNELEQQCAQMCGVQNVRTKSAQTDVILFETYDKHRREWEQRCAQLEQGIMMYQYKLEEFERRMKLLPAPPEIVSSQLQEKEEALNVEVEYRQQLASALQEKEAQISELEAELHETKKPWWKKWLWKVK